VTESEKHPRTWLVLVVVAVGAIAGGALMEYYQFRGAPAPGVTSQAQGDKPAGYESDVDRLKDLVPSQSHTMADVGYHWSALWFAAKEKNWPLARFFFNEARQHIRWTIAIRPVRKGPDGKDVNIKGIYDAIEPSALAAVQLAIDDQDAAAFEMTYREALTACYSCHKAAGLAFLRPGIPTVPPQTIITYDPNAKWPE
jgi:hypothetical protein